MNILNKLTLRHLRLNRGRTIITLFGIVLSVAMICCVTGYIYSYHDYAYRSVIDRRGDWHFGFEGILPETAEKITEDDTIESWYQKERLDSKELVDIYFRLGNLDKNYGAVIEQVDEIMARFDLSTVRINGELMSLEGVNTNGSINVFLAFSVVLLTIISISSVLVIANSFQISLSERVRQIGLLKSAGATKKQIRYSVLFEAFILSVIAIPLGVIVGIALQYTSMIIINETLLSLKIIRSDALALHMIYDPIILGITLIISVFVVFLSAWQPARWVANNTVIDAIRQPKEIFVRKEKLKTSPLVRFFFGFEGDLALKSLKRSKAKNRSAMVSLIIAVVLFICVWASVDMMKFQTMMYFADKSFNVSISVVDNLIAQDEIEEYLLQRTDLSFNTLRTIKWQADMPSGFYTESYKNYCKERSIDFTSNYLYAIPDAEFNKYSFARQGEIPGILVNTSGNVWFRGRLREFVPFSINMGEKLILHPNNAETVSITFVDEMREKPGFLPIEHLWGGNAIILIPESAYREIAPLFPSYFTTFNINVNNAEAFCSEIRDRFPKTSERTIYYDNREERFRMDNANILGVNLFGYGFVLLLSLISVANVIATITTDLSLRQREFAMLYSIGMTNKGLNKMLNLESLMYSTKALVIGIPLGIIASYAFYAAFQNTMEFPFRFPGLALLLCVAAVILVTFVVMRSGKGKLNKISIVEAIRNETT